MIPVILSGGSGSRMWPYSRSAYPKQLLPLASNKTMLQDTIGRLINADPPIVICNEAHRFMVAEQLREIDVLPRNIILEPVGKNTAPAIAIAALKVLESEDQLLLVLPADHVIKDVAAFHNALNIAQDAAMNGDLITFGILPEYAESGYGYIKASLGDVACKIDSFLEKPDISTAQSYVDSGDYFWNSGMFVFKASSYISELEIYAPEILDACRKSLSKAENDLDFVRLDRDCFIKCPSDSVDYAVLEKTDNVKMVSLDVGWSDVGSWASLWSVLDKDEEGNAVRGDVFLEDTTDCLIQGDGKLIATVGIKDTIVVQTDDSVLVASKDSVQDVKNIVSRLKDLNRSETTFHRKVYRPWGNYDSVDSGQRFQVKRIVVNPKAKLSLQMHHHRAEHWIVVSGVAEVINGEQTLLLKENESTYIPIGVKHSLANPGNIPLEIIEVQSGSYLGEDDIVRFEDIYGRA